MPWGWILTGFGGLYGYHRTRSASGAVGLGLFTFGALNFASMLFLGGLFSLFPFFSAVEGEATLVVGSLFFALAAVFAVAAYVGWRMYRKAGGDA